MYICSTASARATVVSMHNIIPRFAFQRPLSVPCACTTHLLWMAIHRWVSPLIDTHMHIHTYRHKHTSTQRALIVARLPFSPRAHRSMYYSDTYVERARVHLYECSRRESLGRGYVYIYYRVCVVCASRIYLRV